MFIRYNLVYFIFSLFLNLCFLFLLFSNLQFTSKTTETLKVKLVSNVITSKNLNVHPDSEPWERTELGKDRTLSKDLVSKKEGKFDITENKEEKLLEERLTRIIKSKQKEVETTTEELGLLNKKIASLKKKAKEGVSANYRIEQQGSHGGSTGYSLGQGTYGFKAGGQALSQEYLLLIKRKLQNHFEIPIYLRTQKDLAAMVRINIGSDGRLVSYAFIKKSPVGEFNSAVERCLKTASPLPVDRPVQVVVEFKATGVGKLE